MYNSLSRVIILHGLIPASIPVLSITYKLHGNSTWVCYLQCESSNELLCPFEFDTWAAPLAHLLETHCSSVMILVQYLKLTTTVGIDNSKLQTPVIANVHACVDQPSISVCAWSLHSHLFTWWWSQPLLVNHQCSRHLTIAACSPCIRLSLCVRLKLSNQVGVDGFCRFPSNIGFRFSKPKNLIQKWIKALFHKQKDKSYVHTCTYLLLGLKQHVCIIDWTIMTMCLMLMLCIIQCICIRTL